MKSLWYLLLCAPLITLSCRQKAVPYKSYTSPKDSSTKPSTENKLSNKNKNKNLISTAKFVQFLTSYKKDSIAKSTLTYKGYRFHVDTFTLSIYNENSLTGFWMDSAHCHEIINVLNSSRFDGLNPKDYKATMLDSLFVALYRNKKNRNDTLYWIIELEVTKNYLRYLNHIRYGKTNPELIFQDWNYERTLPLPFNAKEIKNLLHQSPDKVIQALRPKNPIYEPLRSVLISVDKLKKDSTYSWDRIPYPNHDLKLGDTSPIISKVKSRLQSIGVSPEDSLTNIVDEELIEALTNFQERVGLSPTNKIDRSTIDKLNFTLQDIENTAKVNMERARWLINSEPSGRYIIVNIADFYLRVYENEKEVYKTKIVVGSATKETPLFNSTLRTIEFNPFWTVPRSISTQELLPKIKTDNTFLYRNEMEVLRGDSVVQITDFSSYSKNNFPFVIRQKPGVANSLGVVKFLFPNPYSVYLHDTPSKSMFEKNTRAFSHGCIRVQEPLLLAAFLLADQGRSLNDIQKLVKKGENIAILVEKKIPIFITYWTCSINQEGELSFFKDIYGRDKMILKALTND